MTIQQSIGAPVAPGPIPAVCTGAIKRQTMTTNTKVRYPRVEASGFSRGIRGLAGRGVVMNCGQQHYREFCGLEGFCEFELFFPFWCRHTSGPRRFHILYLEGPAQLSHMGRVQVPTRRSLGAGSQPEIGRAHLCRPTRFSRKIPRPTWSRAPQHCCFVTRPLGVPGTTRRPNLRRCSVSFSLCLHGAGHPHGRVVFHQVPFPLRRPASRRAHVPRTGILRRVAQGLVYTLLKKKKRASRLKIRNCSSGLLTRRRPRRPFAKWPISALLGRPPASKP